MPNNYEAGKVIVALNRNLVYSDSDDFYTSIFDGINFEKVEVIFHPQIKKESDSGNILLFYLKHKNKSEVMETIKKLSMNPHVLYAEPDYLAQEFIIPNDPLFKYLWGTERIKAPLAWNYTTGSSDVAVGVIDSGIDHYHPDIRNNMWTSPDGKFANGWNFFRNNGDSTDLIGHGTRVAGTIGAVGNNNIGITGVCWNVRVASLRFGFDFASAIAAIDFANAYKISILNASWGSRAYSQALKFAIEQYDGLFIAAAGNSGTNNDVILDYPSSYGIDNIISVAATNPNDTLASFSNYGAKSIDIAAPGTDIMSLSLHGGYTRQSGTSMSAPHVAGAAALLKSYMPNLNALDIKFIILSSVDKNFNLNGKISSGGILNVNAMFEMANRFTSSRLNTGAFTQNIPVI